jgi:SlyX protein
MDSAMNETPSVGARIEALEVRIAYQDETIETLNRTITEQWKQIDALTREITILRDRITEAENNASGPGESEPPPPHY